MSLTSWTIAGLGPDSDVPGEPDGARREVAQICAPVLVVANAWGATRVTSTKRIMHFVYVLAGEDRGVGTRTGKSGPPPVRFNLCGSHALNHRGTLYLADGDPADTYNVSITLLPLDRQHLHYHHLTGYRSDLGEYVLPPFHSRIIGRNNVDYAVGPFAGPFHPNALEIGAGGQILAVNRQSEITTAWYG